RPVGLAELLEDPPSREVRDVPAEAGHGGTHGALILHDDVAELFGVELAGERRRADEVAEHDRQLAALARRELVALPISGRGRVPHGQLRATLPAELLGSFDTRTTRRAGRREPATRLGAEAAVRAVLPAAGRARHRLGSARERSVLAGESTELSITPAV